MDYFVVDLCGTFKPKNRSVRLPGPPSVRSREPCVRGAERVVSTDVRLRSPFAIGPMTVETYKREGVRRGVRERTVNSSDVTIVERGATLFVLVQIVYVPDLYLEIFNFSQINGC